MGFLDAVGGFLGDPRVQQTALNLGAGLYTQQIQKKQAKQARKNQAAMMTRTGGGQGYGGVVDPWALARNQNFNLLGGARYLGESLPVPSGGGGAVDWFDVLGGVLDVGSRIAGGPNVGNVARNERMSYVDEFGNVVSGGSSTARRRMPANCPAKLEVPGINGRPCTYVYQGAPILFSKDISAVKRVQRVASICAGALLGKATTRRRKKKKRAGRRRVACRTLTPKQLAAGFGGKRFKR
jgi:hypothetical protein